MHYIEKKNNISDLIYTVLGDEFAVGEHFEAPDAYLVRSADLHGDALPESLLAIGRAGAGVNNIPIDRCNEKGIIVFNTPGANANAVKELVLAGMLLAGRKIISGIDWCKSLQGGGEAVTETVEEGKKQFTGPELAGKTLGVIGLGAIGVQVANAAHYGLSMNVLGYDPYISVDAAWGLSRSVRHAASLDQIYAECDYVTLHLPLNASTKNMIGAVQLEKFKEGAVLLNFARGGLVDSKAVVAALDGGKLRRYVTDFPEYALLCCKGVIAMPHLGASTPESEENCAVMAATELKNYLLYGNVRNAINLPNCELPKNGNFRITLFHHNIPNMVGQITAILAADNINIEHMVNNSRGEYAYTIIDIEPPVGEEGLEKLRAIKGMVRVRVIG
ncbi:MAG TPA: phosphoglycerate dehydrogenase [Terriglobales bacterium]|nr:phosphoglycerate dehydrogenase [Terriglobales bacterium]